MRLISLKWLFCENHVILFFQVATRSSPIFYVGFGVDHLISLFTQQACRHPRSIFETFCAHTSDFFFVHWSVFQFHWMTIPENSRNYSSRIVDSPHRLFRDELLLEESHSEICPTQPNSRPSPPSCLRGLVRRSPCFRMVDCDWRHVWIVWPLCPFSFWTSLVVWFTGCMGLPATVL